MAGYTRRDFAVMMPAAAMAVGTQAAAQERPDTMSGGARDVLSSEAFHRLALRVSNWGRWGPEDQRGSANLLNPGRTKAALRTVELGETVHCGRPVPALQSAQSSHGRLDLSVDGAGEFSAINDRVTLNLHGRGSPTHLDALAHIYYRGRGYNGRPFPTTAANRVPHNGIEAVHEGIVGRGVLIDLPAALGKPWLEPDDIIFPAQLAKLLRDRAISIETGDIVFVRMGRPPESATTSLPQNVKSATGGLAIECAELIHRLSPSVVVSDGGMEIGVPQVQDLRIPWHVLLITMMGIPLVDGADLKALAGRCGELGRTAFACVIAPLELTGGTSSPVNPICIL